MKGNKEPLLLGYPTTQGGYDDNDEYSQNTPAMPSNRQQVKIKAPSK